MKFRQKQRESGSIYGIYGVDIHPSLWHSILGRGKVHTNNKNGKKLLTYFVLIIIILGLGVGAPPEEKRNASIAGEIKLYTLLRARQTPPGEKPDFVCWKNSSFPVSANCKILLICEGSIPLFCFIIFVVKIYFLFICFIWSFFFFFSFFFFLFSFFFC